MDESDNKLAVVGSKNNTVYLSQVQNVSNGLGCGLLWFQ